MKESSGDQESNDDMAIDFSTIATDLSHSPLIRPSPFNKGKPSCFKLAAITLVFAAVQFVWSIEMGYGTPFLLSFGMSKSVLTLAWLAGPLSGLLMQPLVGAWSDRCRWQCGRRRPFIVAGTVVIITSLFLISYARDIACLLGLESGEVMTAASSFATCLAVSGFYLLDFGINTVQACSRSLIVDVLSTRDQPRGHAYASVMIAAGNVVGYAAGAVDLVQWDAARWMFGGTQMKVLASMASVLLVSCTLVTCLNVTEDVVIAQHSHDTERQVQWYDPLKHILQPHKFPRRLRLIFVTQFLAWIAWFPFSFLSTEFIKELWITHQPASSELEAVRMGSVAMVIFSVSTILANLILPPLTRLLSISLRTVWSLSQLGLALLLLTVALMNSYVAVCLVMCGIGVSMAVSLWVPFALVGQFISTNTQSNKNKSNYKKESVSTYNDSETCASSSTRKPISPTNLDHYHEETVPLTLDHGTGMILGLHNAYIVLPQFLSSIVCSMIFAVEPEHGIRWIWVMAACASFMASMTAANLCRRNDC